MKRTTAETIGDYCAELSPVMGPLLEWCAQAAYAINRAASGRTTVVLSEASPEDDE